MASQSDNDGIGRRVGGDPDRREAHERRKTMAGRVGIVTGGSKGIGRAIAETLAAEGASVVITARNTEEVERAAGELRAQYVVPVYGVTCDVRDLEQVQAMVAKTMDDFGHIDILIANAGVGRFGSIEDLSPEAWHQVMDTNLTGVFNSCREVVPPMRESGGGWIITIGSLAGKNTFPGGIAYNASKFGLVGFTEALMLDVRHHGIRVSTVMPGSVDTYFNERTPGSEESRWKLTSGDVAACVLSLLNHDPRSLPSRVELRPAQPPQHK